MDKKKLFWFTQDCFLDVDFGLVPYMKQHCSLDIQWFVIQTKNGVKIADSDQYKTIHLPYRSKDPRLFFFLLKEFSTIEISAADLIYSDTIGSLYYYPAMHIAKKRRTPVIHAAHNVEPYPVWSTSLRIAVKQAFAMNHHVQLFSKHTAKYFSEHYPEKSMFYAPMTVKDFGPVSTDKYDVDPSKVNLLFFGNIVANKRLDLMIEAMKMLPPDIARKVNLSICGNCRSDKDKYIRMIGDAPNIKCYFKRIDDEDIPELFTKHDYLMLPYEDVAQSGPHMIAYNYYLPVIASDIPGFTERIIDGVNGFVFRRNDPSDLAEKISKTVGIKGEKYLAMKDRLSSYIKDNFSYESISKKYTDYFARCME